MPKPRILFDNVSKKFRRGERHDSLRDLFPALARRAWKRRGVDALDADEFWALRNVSFEVNAGEAVGIIGSNGAGKSTTLKILSRILRPTSGHCEVRGRAGALIEVASGFHPDLTGRENVFLQGALMGMSRAETAKCFDEIVDFAGVAAFIDTPVKRYSSGMNARLGFSIAAHLNPDVLIIDEVLSVGDMAFQRRCVERMESFLRRGVAIAFVSHNLAAVSSMCASSVLLKAGVPVSAGRTSDVLRSYVSGGIRASADPSDRSRSSETLEVRGFNAVNREALMEMQPGEDLKIRLLASTGKRLSSLLLVTYVVEETSQTVAFNCNTPLAHTGDESSTEFTLSLTLNLLRGIYSLNLSLYDPERQEHLVWLKPALTIGIAETESYAGIAHLNLKITDEKIALHGEVIDGICVES